MRHLIAAVNAYAHRHLDDDIGLSFAGTMAWMSTMSDYIAEGQQQSMLLASLGISVLLILTLRSVMLGLMATLTGVFPVVMALGQMGFAGIHMHLTLAILAPVVIGVAGGAGRGNLSGSARRPGAVRQSERGVALFYFRILGKP